MSLRKFIAAHNTPLPEKHDVAKAARSLRLAQQCIRRVLKRGNEHQALLTLERTAELEATCIILMRAEADVWKQFPRA